MDSISPQNFAPVISGWFDCDLAPAKSATPIRDANGDTMIEGPSLLLRAKSACALHVTERTVTAVIGEPRDHQMQPLTAADATRIVDAQTLASLHGRFAIVHIDFQRRTATLLTDRFAVLPLCYSIDGSRIAFADRADAVLPFAQREIDPQAIFNYVYFHVIPSPLTIFRGVRRLESAMRLQFDATGVHLHTTWRPQTAAQPHFDFDRECKRFRALLQQSVARETGAPPIGAYLSGGTDSSTVIGMLRQQTREPIHAFSIGFDTGGYDEMAYARHSAQHFGCTLHEHYLTPQELVRSIPAVAAHYDQPFGISSALPAYYCATLAREYRIEKLLAGDGGDELFGGNVRYARQQLFAAYDALPSRMRSNFVEPLLLRPSIARMPIVRKLARYVEQARLPMPERLESYNLLQRFGAAAVFTPTLLNRVDPAQPRTLQREVYQSIAANSIIDRMLAYDWRFTLTDSDLPKVRSTAELAGATVGFPLLDDQLVDFSLSLPASMKVRRLKLRYFFKQALRGFLPEQTIRKKKHGFGLPFGPWLMRDKPLAHFAEAALDQLAARNVIRRELVHDLFSTRLHEHPGFYGEMVWVLMMLEHWLARHQPSFSLD